MAGKPTKTVMAARRVRCKICLSKLPSKSKLEKHMELHTDKSEPRTEKPPAVVNYQCTKCSKTFRSQVMQKRHMSVCDKASKNLKLDAVNHTPKTINPSLSRLVPSASSKKENELKEHMFTKVQSIFDITKSSDLIINSPAKDLEVLKTASTLSVDGIQNMSILLKNSMKSITVKSKAAAKMKETNQKCSTHRHSSRASVKNKKFTDTSSSGTPVILEDQPTTLKKTASQVKKTNTEVSRCNGRAKQSASTTGLVKKTVVKKAKDSMGQKGKRKSTSSPKQIPPSKKKKLESIIKEIPKKKHGVLNVKTSVKRSSKKDARDNKENESSCSNDDYEDDDDYDDDETDGGNSTALIKGKKSKGRQRQFACAQCTKVFSRKYHLDRHLKVSACSGLPPPSFPCQVCNRVYTRKDNLREHLRMHTGDGQRKKNHKCDICSKAFHGQSLLTIHMRTHTGEKPYTCDRCSKPFPSTGALAKHKRTHTGEKPFVCPECGCSFSLKGTLNRHLRVHSGYRPHLCVYCGKRFIQIGGLKAHLFYHTGENGYRCEDCGKIFNRKARLHMHKLYVHSKLRPYNCDRCSKTFTRKEDLLRHSVLHTGAKPFNCPTCNKSFAIKPSLKLHLLTHTKEEPRSCHECGRAFIRKDCLLRHMRKRHRELLDKITMDEKDEKVGEQNAVSSRMLSEDDLCEKIQELLSLLVEESTLVSFGWPDKPVDEVLESVIRRCGHTPVSTDDYSFMDRMRENAKLLFTVVIDDNAVKTLLNNQTVDEVILHVLRLAKT